MGFSREGSLKDSGCLRILGAWGLQASSFGRVGSVVGSGGGDPEEGICSQGSKDHFSAGPSSHIPLIGWGSLNSMPKDRLLKTLFIYFRTRTQGAGRSDGSHQKTSTNRRDPKKRCKLEKPRKEEAVTPASTSIQAQGLKHKDEQILLLGGWGSTYQ